MNPSAPDHDVFRAIGDPSRRRILELLSGGEMAIAQIVGYLAVSRTAANKHLAVLAEAGLVTSRKAGRETRYRLQPGPLVELEQWLSFFEPFWNTKLSALKEYVEGGNDKESDEI